MSGQNGAVKPETGTCRRSCGATGMVTRSGRLVCGVVVLAVVSVTAAPSLGGKEAAPQTQGVAVSAAVSATDPTWGTPLKSMRELKVLATNTETVFVVVPSDDAARTEAIQREVTAAVSALTEGGTNSGKFLLGKETADYKVLVEDFGAPAVLIKGARMNAVTDKNVTKDALLKAFASVSRPLRFARPMSGCGAGGCGPKGCGPAAPQDYNLSLPRKGVDVKGKGVKGGG